MEGEVFCGGTDDFDLIIGIESLDDISFLSVGVVAIGANPPVVEVLVGLDGDEVNGAVGLIEVSVFAEVAVEFVGAGTTGDDISSVTAMDEVVTAFGIDDVGASETTDGV